MAPAQGADAVSLFIAAELRHNVETRKGLRADRRRLRGVLCSLNRSIY